MAGDLATMKARIASELGRPNLTNEIADAISTAIAAYQKERFRFSDAVPNAPTTFNTVPGRYIYTSADNANISTLFNFDYVHITIGTTVQYLEHWLPSELKLYIQQNTMAGQPGWYAYEGNQLMLAPIPSLAYPVELGIFKNIPAPANDAEAGNPWMLDAELLIRARAKYEIAVHKTRNPTMAQQMSPYPPNENGGALGAAYGAWRDLKRVANRVTSTGRVRPMRF